MQLTAVLLLGLCLQVTAKVVSQTVTIDVKDAPLVSVFEEVKRQTGYLVISNAEHLAMAKPVTISSKEESLSAFFHRLLLNQPLTYVISNTTIAIRKKKEVTKTSLFDHAPPVTGVLLHAETNEPLVGASITIKGTKNTVVSDANGKFSINANAGDVIVVSYVGFRSKEIVVSGNAIDVIYLQPASNDLQEVVVNKGYYKTTQRLNTGNVSKVTSKEIEQQPVGDPMASLVGRVPGLQVTQGSGLPGRGFIVTVRGRNSISGANNPLYVVDGVPFFNSSAGGQINIDNSSMPNQTGYPSSPFNLLDISNIESIEVLKDGDATAIYGSRGANGVILITTKRGKQGKTQVNANFYAGIANATRFLDLMNTQQYLAMRWEAFRNAGITPTMANAPDLLLWDTTRYTDWQKELLGGTARYTDAQLSVTGGNVQTQFNIGGSFHRESTIIPGKSFDQRGSSHVSVIHKSMNSRFKVNVNFQYSINSSILPDQGGFSITAPPNSPKPYSSDGQFNWENSTWINPYAALLKETMNKSKSFNSSVQLGYKLNDDLSISLNAGYNSITGIQRYYDPRRSQNPSIESVSRSSLGNNQIDIIHIEPQIDYNKIFGSNEFQLLLGTTYSTQDQESNAVEGLGFVSDALLDNLRAASQFYLLGNSFSQYRYNAVFSRIGYNYGNKYIINLTFRRDGSSRFGPGKQFSNFGAFAAAWIFSDENFIKNHISFLSLGKMRFSYGLTGNDLIGDYQYLDTYGPTNAGTTYLNSPGLSYLRLFNPDYAWEKNKKLEFAIDLNFFKDRVLLNASYYRNRSSNQLLNYPLPTITGGTSILSNLPATVQNTGLELELSSVNLRTSEFKWSSSFQITIPKNKLISFPNLDQSSYANTYVIGQPLLISKVYKLIGVNSQTGVYDFEDIDKDESITSTDRQHIINRGQQFYGSFGNIFQYRKLTLSFFFQFVRQDYNYNMFFSGFSPINTPGSRFNQPTNLEERWKTPGDNSEYQLSSLAGSAVTTFSNYRLSNAAFTNASFIRLKNVSLSYQLHDRWIKKVGLNEGVIFCNAQNLFTVTSYLGLDPETNIGRVPPLRAIALGIRMSF